nr:hypothetical protein [Tanacetum cinerariifolium]
MHFYRLSHSELVDIEKVAVCSSLRTLKPKRTIKSRAKRSSKIISLGHYSIMLASSHTVKMKMEILLEPTSNKLLVANELTDAFGKPFEVLNHIFEHWVFNSLVHSFHALSALRRFGLRTANTAAKPCQGDSSEFYLITGRILTVIAAGQRDVNSQLHAYTSKSLSMTQRTPATEKASTEPSAQPQDDTSANIIHETPSPADAEIGTDTDKRNRRLNLMKARLDQTLVKLPSLDLRQMKTRLDQTLEKVMWLAGPNPEPMHDDFMATVYLKVHESLKFLVDEHVILEDPRSLSRKLSSTKNMDDTYTFGDQFFNDKSTKDESRKQNVDAEVVSIVTVPIHQASTSVPPISTSIIDLSPLKQAASPLPEQFTATTAETTTTTEVVFFNAYIKYNIK